MGPVVTWIVLANTREAKVLANRGPGTGLVPVAGRHWRADETHSIGGDSRVERDAVGGTTYAVHQADARRRLNALFVRQVVSGLARDLASEQFDRFILVAGPLMLGLMTDAMDHRLKYALVDELVKDLSALPVAAIETRLGEIIPI